MTARRDRFVGLVCEPNARLATVLLLAFVVLLPFEPLYNVPLLALGALGLWCLGTRRVRLGAPENRFLCLAFGCLALPLLASAPDAVSPIEAIRKTASLGVCFLAGVWVVGAYTRFRDLDRVLAGVTVVCVLWSLDGLWQLHTGFDWFGVPLPHRYGERLSGPFFVDGMVGYVLAALAPLFFEGVRRASRRWPWAPILLAPFVMAILLSGSRTSWLSLALGAAGYVVYLVRWAEPRARRRSGRIAGRVAGTAAVVAVLAVALTATARSGDEVRAWKIFEERMERLAGLWSEDPEERVLAISYRTVIWETGVNVFAAHWLNGVGPRGFREVYDDYNPERDHYYRSKASPHLLVLEIAVAAGMIGVLGYVLLAAAFVRRLRRLDPGDFRAVYPWALTLFVVLFPLDGYGSFYGSPVAKLIWWTIIAGAAAFAIVSRQAPTPPPPPQPAG